jgi:Cu+-exporting ATPase
MLLGRYLQDKTYENLSFSRDYSSYFPLSAHVWNAGKEQEVAISEIKISDEIIVHNQEIIVCDGILASGLAVIDYSFVTGESTPVTIHEGEWLYAGGRQLGTSIRLIAQKTVAQGYLVSLWNQSAKENESAKLEIPIQTDENQYIHIASQWFTLGLFLIAITAAFYWLYKDSSQILHVVTSILIVACPCALLLSVTFTNGHILSALARHGLYIRNATTLERWRNSDVVIFDKTGTLTDTTHPDIQYSGKDLSDEELDLVAAVSKESIHPIARSISKFLDRAQVPLENVENVNGQGVRAKSSNEQILLGNRSFVGLSENYSVGESGLIDSANLLGGSEIWVRINHKILGVFMVKSRYRQNLEGMINAVGKRATVSILSGDNSSEESQLLQLIPHKTPVKFEVKPHEKKDYIAQLQLMGKKVMMVGDGLNDVAAMQQANFSVAVTENVGFFTPGSDAIILGSSLNQLHRLWGLAIRAKRVIWWSFAISIVYNIVGLSFAVSGSLNPLIAAILMPVSSISIVIFTYVASNWGYWLKR